MLSKLFVALLVMASPTAAQDAPPADQPQSDAVTDPKAAPYKLKKVCRAQEVVGSIPRTVCSTKRVYLKPGEEASADDNDSAEPQSRN